MALSVPYVFTAGTTILSDEVDADFTALLDAVDKRGDTMTGALTLDVPLTVASGGTGLGTLTANNVILGNGASTPSFVAPSTSGNLLTSNGTTWVSSPGGSAAQSIYFGRHFGGF